MLRNQLNRKTVPHGNDRDGLLTRVLHIKKFVEDDIVHMCWFRPYGKHILRLIPQFRFRGFKLLYDILQHKLLAMEPLQGVNFSPSRNDPTTYCRLCLSKAGLQILASASEPVNLVQLIRKQLDIQLIEPDDFPCAICKICGQKLEELFECNDDGLLNEWGDDGLREYRQECQAVNLEIKRSRNADKTNSVNDETLVLPFQQLSDGRYQCKECSNSIFADISTCLKHHRESHLNTIAQKGIGHGLKGTTAKKRSYECDNVLISHRPKHSGTNEILTKGKDGLNSEIRIKNNSAGRSTERKRQCYKCVNCNESFGNINNLIEHNCIHKADGVKDKRQQFMIENHYTKCKECNVEFPDKKTFYVHLNAIHDLNICNICDETFSASSVLTKHQAYHRNLNDIIMMGRHSFHCKVCFEKFSSAFEIRLHYQMQHSDLNNVTEDKETSSAVVSTSTERNI